MNKQSTDEELAVAGSGCNDTSCCPPNSPTVRTSPKVGRNDPCICGNGKKFKKCCGKSL